MTRSSSRPPLIQNVKIAAATKSPVQQPPAKTNAAEPPNGTKNTAVAPINSIAGLAIVIAVPDQRLATLIGSRIKAWLLPKGTDIPVHVIATNDETDTTKVATALMHLGYNPNDVKTAFPKVTLGWPDDRPDSP